MNYDLVIIGGGPAGAAAAVYAARKKIKTLLLTRDFGGQSIVSPEIQNWIGTIAISGDDLAKQLKAHVLAYKGDVLEIKEGEMVAKIEKSADGFTITSTPAGAISARAVLITTGGARRKIEAVGADKFEQKGITYCASCDGPLFAGQDVVVVGGGNAAFETALQLLAYAKTVTILHRNAEFNKADAVTVEKVLKNPNAKAITNAKLKEIKGDKFVSSLVYEDAAGQDVELPTTGIFAEIGMMPATDFAGGLVERNPVGYIVVNPKNQRASIDGVWAAGDCTDGLYHQNSIAAGDAIKALEDIYYYLNAK